MIRKISKIISTRLLGRRSYCPVCDTDDVGFGALDDLYQNNALKHGYVHFGKGEMTALDTYSCLNCGASDRERLYAHWIRNQFKTDCLSSRSKVIHFAPETALSTWLKTLSIGTYHTADLLMKDCDYKVDMLSMPFADESYDFFICSHVLEHVESDDHAIAELYRITQKGGCGILMAPVIVGLKNTIEDKTIKDKAGRWKHFGQDDHVRLYAHDDYLQKIRSQGFSVRQLGRKYFTSKLFARLGLKKTSILYVVQK